MIFDLGLREDAENYIPPVAERIRARVIINVKEDVFDSPANANIDLKTDIYVVIFSHLHYDHVGHPSKFSAPKTKFVIGPGAMNALLAPPKHVPGRSRFDL
ncbi:hypothetical protein GX48_00745 [Paracoccidioides brasiliensis]|nr:hypothetical protein GX48_00745 [Paracoccidioides brasiliensis]